MKRQEIQWIPLLLRSGLGGISGALFCLSVLSVDPDLNSEIGVIVALAMAGVGVIIWEIAQIARLWILWGIVVLSGIIAGLSVSLVLTAASIPITFNVNALSGLALGIGILVAGNLLFNQLRNTSNNDKELESMATSHQWKNGREVVVILCCFGFIMMMAYNLYPVNVDVMLLERAIRNDDSDTVLNLLNQGIDVNIQHWYLNNTPLHEAASYGNTSVMRLLLERGADVNMTNGADGEIPLHRAATLCRNSAIELLLTYHSNINARDSNGNIPLHNAAYFCDISTVDFFLAHGASVNTQNMKGETPLQKARERGNSPYKEEVIKLLRRYGAT